MFVPKPVWLTFFLSPYKVCQRGPAFCNFKVWNEGKKMTAFFGQTIPVRKTWILYAIQLALPQVYKGNYTMGCPKFLDGFEYQAPLHYIQWDLGQMRKGMEKVSEHCWGQMRLSLLEMIPSCYSRRLVQRSTGAMLAHQTSWHTASRPFNYLNTQPLWWC